MSNDEQQILRSLILFGLGQVPEVGKLLSALTGIFWRPSENLWDEFKVEVEALIEEDLAKYDEKQVQDDLDGLKLALDDYQQACTDGDVTTIRTQWEICKDLFDEQLPHFQTSDYQLQLLLLFVQYANLYLSLLRDGVLFGATWGKNPSEVYTILTTLRTKIGSFQYYTEGVVSAAVANKLTATGSDKHAVEPLRTVNAYTRLLTINALDVAALWRYFEPGSIPSNPPFMRYIYSDPVGTSDDAGSDVAIITPPASGQGITGVRIWADSGAVYATQLQYGGSVFGPVYGFNDRGAADLPPYGGSFPVSPDNPITAVLVAAGDHIQGLQFQLKDNSRSQVFGNGSGLTALDNYGEMVGDLYVASSSVFYNSSAACLIVGYIPMPS